MSTIVSSGLNATNKILRLLDILHTILTYVDVFSRLSKSPTYISVTNHQEKNSLLTSPVTSGFRENY